MKTVRIAYIILFAVIIAVIINSIALSGIISDIGNYVISAEEEDMAAAEKEYRAIYDKYKKNELYISLTVSHDDLSNLEDAFSEIIGAARAGDRETVITTKSRLIDYLRHIRRLSGINFDSIF